MASGRRELRPRVGTARRQVAPGTTTPQRHTESMARSSRAATATCGMPSTSIDYACIMVRWYSKP
jgi:hypothetical protein